MANKKVEVCIDLGSLYDSYYESGVAAQLMYGSIVEVVANKERERYYDMYNSHDQVCCMDGEVHEVVDVSEDGEYIEFVDNNGESDEPVYFRLAFKEAQIALSDYDLQEIEKQYKISLGEKEKPKAKAKADRDDR